MLIVANGPVTEGHWDEQYQVHYTLAYRCYIVDNYWHRDHVPLLAGNPAIVTSIGRSLFMWHGDRGKLGGGLCNFFLLMEGWGLCNFFIPKRGGGRVIFIGPYKLQLCIQKCIESRFFRAQHEQFPGSNSTTPSFSCPRQTPDWGRLSNFLTGTRGAK